MTNQANELQAINTAWQIAIQEILRMVEDLERFPFMLDRIRKS